MAFRCPNTNCVPIDHDPSFTIYGAVETHHEITVDSDGDCIESYGGDIEWGPTTRIRCDDCNYEGTVAAFEIHEQEDTP